ncbi:MAG TPA: UDP-N-acetylmuramoyl-L-alanyl-D-glutamate--2,6-diaminopimelate ligase [Candidatus Corynebacterium gallistercoris]|uniref:UDP-N-acetylmuramoyl-L-alanyl-D-glutamate--2,6-diaminopimelate ligase n=1 Tax=Candidatus Corynebacterium gallistercoris TaxID=2838530 RepID=A0A9D1RZC6_9CORY|nr:UDP-N-acetylmuramoyl-L-alanyl-D-glutamate--2,6-diaminopimelate ligase [Candidatus Corynebacterium gallistercoris]
MTSLKRLSELTGGSVIGDASVELTSAAIGSADVLPGGLFCAVPGAKAHGASFAAGSSAAAVLTDAAGAAIISDATSPDQLPILVVGDVREWMGPVAAEIYGHPSRDMTVVGITGTSGKTTTSYLAEAAFMATGAKVGIIGTTGTRIDGRAIPTKLTTPEAPTMQSLLAHMRDEQVTHVIMEVSSHALELGRVSGIDFDVASFTNLSQDHLDFHPTMEDYFQAKASLFDMTTNAVVCVDDDWGRRMADLAAQKGSVIRVGEDWRIDEVEVRQNGRQDIVATAGGRTLHYSISMAGAFNQVNSLIALACVSALGGDVNVAAAGIADVHVPGRMQLVDEGQDFIAMVDYAHKPGAVAAVLDNLKDYRRIGIVLGAGGNRDADKRPVMGKWAGALADAVFVTDDNPRDEDPEAIRESVYRGAVEAGQADTIVNIADRAEAIAAAVDWAEPGDAIVVAGKGHEKGQLVRGVMYDFDDVLVVQEALRRKVGGEA